MGELARKPGAPQLPKTPLELMTPRPGEGFSDFDKLIWPVAGTFVGLGSSVVRNIQTMKPFWSGIHRHVILAGAFCYFAIFVRDIKHAARAESDEVIKHYISLHPEDFPAFERKRWSEVYLPFKPIR